MYLNYNIGHQITCLFTGINIETDDGFFDCWVRVKDAFSVEQYIIICWLSAASFPPHTFYSDKQLQCTL
jgi:hypothetical protein